jgi:hypothetical protein
LLTSFIERQRRGWLLTKLIDEWCFMAIRVSQHSMMRPLANQLFTVLLGSTLEDQFTEQKMLMSLVNLPKQVNREVTTAGNPTLRVQHDAFTAIILFDHRTQQMSSAMLRLEPPLYKSMLAYARSEQWLENQTVRKNTQLQWRRDDTGLSQRLVFLSSESEMPQASVAFFDYPGIFDAHTVHFRREQWWISSFQRSS